MCNFSLSPVACQGLSCSLQGDGIGYWCFSIDPHLDTMKQAARILSVLIHYICRIIHPSVTSYLLNALKNFVIFQLTHTRNSDKLDYIRSIVGDNAT